MVSLLVTGDVGVYMKIGHVWLLVTMSESKI